MLSAAHSAWDTKALTGSVIDGRYRLERSLTASEDAIIYTAIDSHSGREVVVELSRRPARSEQLAPMPAGNGREGITSDGLHFAVTEHAPALDLGDWKLARRVCETLAGTYWQTADGTLLIELPALASSAPSGLRHALPPPARASAQRTSLDELSPDLIPIQVDEPRDTERPVVSDSPGGDPDTRTPAKSRRAPVVLLATLSVAFALIGHVGWRGATARFPFLAPAPPAPRAAAARPVPVEPPLAIEAVAVLPPEAPTPPAAVALPIASDAPATPEAPAAQRGAPAPKRARVKRAPGASRNFLPKEL